MAPPKPDEAAIFNVARQIDAPEVRRLYLEQACAGDRELQLRLERLLHVHDEDRGFLEAPALGAPTTAEDRIVEGAGTQIGPYKLLEKIGEGGFGKVFMAEQTQPVRRMVALKIVKPGMDTQQVIARFESERQALALMAHPNIAQIIDGGATESGRPYFVMELVRGVPITEFCDKNHLPAAERLKLFISICHAIQHAHYKGLIHRDIKPSNVMVTLHDGTPVVKIIDFGVAKATAQKLTEKTLFTAFGQMIGTPAYMSPEQAEMSGLDIDTRSDIYSLGVLLYELLTGTTPLDAVKLREAGFAEMQRLIREEEPPRPSTRLSSLGDSATILAGNRATDPKHLARLLAGDLDWIVMKALEKDRNRRYVSPGSFAEDVERYLRRDAIIARPPSALYRLRKLAQRHRAAVLTVAAMVAALLVGTAVATWQAIVATGAKYDAVVAAAAEKDAKQTAEAKEAESRAVLDFVERRVFAAARPEGQAGGLGHDVSLRRALQAALAAVDKSFVDQPLVEARVRRTLGNSFLYLSDARTAAEQHERARSIYLGLFGPDDPKTMTSTSDLANSYRAFGRYPESLRLHEDTLARRRAQLGPDHADTLASMNNVANLHDDLGDRAKALSLREETLKRRRATLGAEDPDTLGSMRNLANSYARFNRYDEAIQLEEEALARAKATLGEDHPDTLAIRMNLAISYADVHRYADALKLQEDTLALYKKKLGPFHRETFVAMQNVAKCLADLDRHKEAAQLLEETLKLQKEHLPADHPDFAQTTYSLALRYSSLKRYADSLKLHEEAWVLRKRMLGAEHHDTLYSMWGVAYNLLMLNRGAEAVPIIDECLRLARGKAKNPVFSGLADKRLRYFEQATDAAGCRTTAELWETFEFRDPGSLYNAARFRAVTAAVFRATDKSAEGAKQADAEADRAMAWLQSAVATRYRDAGKLKEDKDLNILRDRADFKKLLADLEAEQEKAKKP
jgi:serine/threonine protein kinase/tetratricopeptide (TPR) repeat protein